MNPFVILRKKFFPYFLFLVAVVSSLVNFFFWRANQEYKREIEELNQQIKQSQEKGLKVIEVTNGDTFVLEGGVRVRLADVDAPELEFCLGQEAKKRLEELVLGKTVQLPFTRPDKFGRLIALVYQGDIWVNQVMLAEGFGRYTSTQTVKEKDQQLLAAGFRRSDQCYSHHWP